MCFYWQPVESKSDNELSLSEIEKISKSVPDLFWLLIGGGEPFVRSDLAEIAKAFYRNSNIKHLSIPTNGTYVRRTEKVVTEILTSCPGVFLNVNLSLNGIGTAHDELCQADGVFNSVLETYASLAIIKETHKNLGIGVNITHSAENEIYLDSIIDFIVTNMPMVDNISLGMVRGRPKDPSLMKVNLDYYKRAVLKIEGLALRKQLTTFNTFLGGVLFAKDMIMRRLLALTSTSGWQIPCLAGKVSFVIDEKANLYPCELLASVGNLREESFAAVKVSSRLMTAVKKISGEHCFCTHECAYSTNILFSPRMWIPLALGYFRFVSARRSKGKTATRSFDDVWIPIAPARNQYRGQLGNLYDGAVTFGTVERDNGKRNIIKRF